MSDIVQTSNSAESEDNTLGNETTQFANDARLIKADSLVSKRKEGEECDFLKMYICGVLIPSSPFLLLLVYDLMHLMSNRVPDFTGILALYAGCFIFTQHFILVFRPAYTITLVIIVMSYSFFNIFISMILFWLTFGLLR